LSAVIETATKGKNTFENIIDLRARYEKKVMAMGRRAKPAHALLLQLFSNPAANVALVSENLHLSISAANTLVHNLEENGILKEVTGFSRNRMFVLHEYIGLFK